MKKMICMVLALVMLLLTGCTDGNSPAVKRGKRDSGEKTENALTQLLMSDTWFCGENQSIRFLDESCGEYSEGESVCTFSWRKKDAKTVELRRTLWESPFLSLCVILDREETPALRCEDDGRLFLLHGEASPEGGADAKPCGGEESADGVTSEEQTAAAAYLPVVERAASEEMRNNLAGFLFDLDDDGMRELVLRYGLRETEYSVARYTFDVYTVADGVAVPRILNARMDGGFVAGSFGDIYIDYWNGERVLSVFSRNGETSGGYYVVSARYKVCHYDPVTLELLRVLELEVEENNVGYTLGYMVDGVTVSEERFRLEVEQCERLELKTDAYDNHLDFFAAEDEEKYERMQNIYALVWEMQKCAGIVSMIPPVQSRQEAVEIAALVWERFLESEDTDWKIFEETSIVKDGAEYYCFTLRENWFGEGRWVVREYLFVDSVTGKYGGELYRMG